MKAIEYWNNLILEKEIKETSFGKIIPLELYNENDSQEEYENDSYILEYDIIISSSQYHAWIPIDRYDFVDDSLFKIKEQVKYLSDDNIPMSVEEFKELPIYDLLSLINDVESKNSFWLRLRNKMIILWERFKQDFKDGLQQNVQNERDRKL